jgi:hypothetical protein
MVDQLIEDSDVRHFLDCRVQSKTDQERQCIMEFGGSGPFIAFSPSEHHFSPIICGYVDRFHTLSDNLPHLLAIIHVPSLKTHSILVHRAPILQISWSSYALSPGVRENHDNNTHYFWELALICQSSRHLYLWSPSGCASVMFPISSGSIERKGSVDGADMLTNKVFSARYINWLQQPSFAIRGRNSKSMISRTSSENQRSEIVVQKGLIAADTQRFIICYPTHIQQLGKD